MNTLQKIGNTPGSFRDRIRLSSYLLFCTDDRLGAIDHSDSDGTKNQYRFHREGIVAVIFDDEYLENIGG